MRKNIIVVVLVVMILGIGGGYIYRLNVEINDLNTQMDDLHKEVDLERKSLTRYTWLVLGDSLTEKNDRAKIQYYDYIKENTGINYINRGRSGCGYVKYQYFYNTIDEFTDDNFDFCTIFGSGNDLDYSFVWEDGRTWQQALGNVTDYGWDSICGAINMTIDKFYEKFPTKKLGIVTPTPWASFSNMDGTINGTQMEDYANALVEICKMRGYHAWIYIMRVD